MFNDALKCLLGDNFMRAELLEGVGIKAVYFNSCNKQTVIDFVKNQFFKDFVRVVLPINEEYSLQKFNDIVLELVGFYDIIIDFLEQSMQVEIIGVRDQVKKVLNLLKTSQNKPHANQRILRKVNQPKVKRLTSNNIICINSHESKISGVKWYQINLLNQIDFVATLKSMFCLSQVEMNSQQNEIKFIAACKEELAKAKTHTISTLRTIVAAEVKCENNELLLSEWRTKKELYLDMIKHLKCVIDINCDSMFVYSTSNEQIKECELIILSAIHKNVSS
jgi:hypothetical protein